MDSLQTIKVAACSMLALGCGGTDYDLFDDALSQDAGTGGQVDAGSGGSAPQASGGAPPLPPPDCISPRDPILDVERVRNAGNSLCVARGAPTTLGDLPAHFVTMDACDQSPDLMWTVRVDSSGAWQLRHEAVDMNLDVRFADSIAGTPLVLFAPHPSYNQRFFALPVSPGTFQLSPRHATTQCVEVVARALELQPCDSTKLAQVFERFECRDDGL